MERPLNQAMFRRGERKKKRRGQRERREEGAALRKALLLRETRAWPRRRAIRDTRRTAVHTVRVSVGQGATRGPRGTRDRLLTLLDAAASA